MDEGPAGAKLAWPPLKEELERLYIHDRLSAAKIAQVYGLSYPSPKTAESTILYHLKRNGIRRRDRAEHIRKATTEMVDDWVKRYQQGESLKQISGGRLSPVTVLNYLRERGVELRDKVEAQIEAVTKHRKRQFTGDPHDKAYMLGLAQGDFYVTRHGRAVRVKSSSTHPSFIQLFKDLFGRYGPVYVYPRKAKLTDYEWSIDADLDGSFGFLLKKSTHIPDFVSQNPQYFFDYFAGFFDAEGTVAARKGVDGRVKSFNAYVTNSNLTLLDELRLRMNRFSIEGKLVRVAESKLSDNRTLIWRLWFWRHEEVWQLLSRLKPRHAEKKSKVILALEYFRSESDVKRSAITSSWDTLLAEIRRAVRLCVEGAGHDYVKKNA